MVFDVENMLKLNKFGSLNGNYTSKLQKHVISSVEHAHDVILKGDKLWLHLATFYFKHGNIFKGVSFSDFCLPSVCLSMSPSV